MNLVLQLQQTPKWKEFEDWYEQQQHNIPLISGDYFGRWYIGLDELGIEFQKGVFEKFIESQGQSYWHGDSGTHYLTYPKTACEEFNSFEELLIWHFNN